MSGLRIHTVEPDRENGRWSECGMIERAGEATSRVLKGIPDQEFLPAPILSDNCSSSPSEIPESRRRIRQGQTQQCA